MSSGEIPTDPEQAERRIGSYRLLEPLGTGGMSSVFRGVHDESAHVVAVKILSKSVGKNTTLLQRFLREAKNAEALQHPNIVSIFDRGVDHGRHYLVLEYVEGGDLHDRVRSEGPLGVEEAVTVVKAVSEGLRYAASKGVIHRDVKPANILMGPDGRVKIIDLGLSLHSESEDERVTRDGTTVGTVDYMAPEQARDSRATSEQSDMYSLGCTLYFLLTGSPPFPGGDIAEKLTRHFRESAPDPRKLRPDVPEPVSRLIQRMMAKRPEARFADYDALIQALDEVLRGPAEGSLTALVDDEEQTAAPPLDALVVDDDDEIGVGPAPLDALVVDDDDDDDSPGASRTETPGRAKPARPATPAAPAREYSIADLAALDPEPTRSPAKPPAKPAAPKPAVVEQPPLAGLSGELEEEEVFEGAMPDAVPLGGSARLDPATRKWIIMLVGGGVALLLFVIGVHQLIRVSTQADTNEVAQTDETTSDGSETPTEASNAEPAPKPQPPVVAATKPANATTSTTKPANATTATTKPANATTSTTKPANGTSATTQIARATPPVTHPIGVPKKAAKTKNEPDVKAPEVWVEPPNVSNPPPAEAVYPPAVEAKLVPEWGKGGAPEKIPGRSVTLRRVGEPNDSGQFTSLKRAFEVIGGTLLVDDVGPFFADDLRFSGDSRLIQSRPGTRSIIAIEAPKLEVVRGQPAVFTLIDRQVVLEGLDLIVDLADLPDGQGALFLCRGTSLTLRDCTITVRNSEDQPFTVFRVESGSKPSRIRLERTFVRGETQSLLDLAGGPVEVAISRSVLAGGSRYLIGCTGSETAAERRLFVERSLLASRGSIIQRVLPSRGRKVGATTVRVLGSTLAHFGKAGPTSLVSFRDEASGGPDLVSWQGDFNTYAGWSDWVSSGFEHTVRVANLAAARTTWASTDAASRETPNPWPDPPSVDRLLPIQFRELSPESLPTLTRVAAPSPYLFEKTIEAFPRLNLPELAGPTNLPAGTASSTSSARSPSTSPLIPSTSPPQQRGPTGARPAPGVRPGTAPAAKGGAAPVPALNDVVFDVQASPWKGDLGLFLKEQAPEGTKRVRVKVTGTGSFGWTPVAMPEGVSLEITVEQTRADGKVPPQWAGVDGSQGQTLIGVRGGDLVLRGLEITRTGGAAAGSIVRVEDGHLVIVGGRLFARGVSDPKNGRLVTFLAPSTKPIHRPDDSGPFLAPSERPICRILDSILITGGDALSAELGHGVVALSNCAVVSGGTMFALSPAKVARHRFEAGLALERCTLATSKQFVHLARWSGEAPGPDRPWLVTTRDCAFVTSFERGAREGILLQLEPGALARGTLFWQANADAYDVLQFTRPDGAATPASYSADVRQQWVALWGPVHIRAVTGPSRVGGSQGVRFSERFRVGEATPEKLVLDPEFHPGRKALEVGADPAKLYIARKATGRRR